MEKVKLDRKTIDDMTNFTEFVICENCEYSKDCREFEHNFHATLCQAMIYLIARH